MRVVVVGATGNVGREMLDTLFRRQFPLSQIIVVASPRSKGNILLYGDKQLVVESIEEFDFSRADVALFSAGSTVASQYAPVAASAGCVVIDNSSYFRYNDDIPLVVPQVNPEDIEQYKKRNIIANPNCSTIQMLVALAPIHRRYNIKRIIVSTYQSTSGAGREAMDELEYQTQEVLEGKKAVPERFTKPIAFNVIPHIDVFKEDGSTKEEWKMKMETQKIMDSKVLVHANCARVPTFLGHGEYINIETEKPMDEKQILEDWSKDSLIEVVNGRENGSYATPWETNESDFVFISRVRKDETISNGLSFWCVSNNIRKGAALNAVEIAEILVKKYL